MKQITDKRAGVFFNAFADTFDTLYEKQRNPLMRTIDYFFRSDIELRFKNTFKEFGNLNNKSILDIGCGSGIYMKHALNNNAEFVCGLDPAENMLKLSKNRLASFNDSKFELVIGNYPEKSIHKKFNFIIVMGVMDYVENPSHFLSALKDVYSESAVLSFPSYHWFRSPIRKVRYNLRNCPIYLYNHNSIETLLKSVDITNFKINKINGAGMDYVVSIYK